MLTAFMAKRGHLLSALKLLSPRVHSLDFSYPLLLDFQTPIIRLLFPNHILKDHDDQVTS